MHAHSSKQNHCHNRKRQTDRQTDRQTERKTDRQGQTDRHKTHLLRLQLRSTDRLRDLLRDDFLRMIRCLGPKMSVIDTKEAQLMVAVYVFMYVCMYV